MNPGICYLYEYKNNQKLRNVGFMKVTPHFRSCILQINARGIPVQTGDSIKLHIFYEKDSDYIAKPIGGIACGDKTIYARLTANEASYPDGKTLEDIGGFFLSANGQFYAALSDHMSFDTARIKMWEEPSQAVEKESLAANALPNANGQIRESEPPIIGAKPEPIPEETIPEETMPEETMPEEPMTEEPMTEETLNLNREKDSIYMPGLQPSPEQRPASNNSDIIYFEPNPELYPAPYLNPDSETRPEPGLAPYTEPYSKNYPQHYQGPGPETSSGTDRTLVTEQEQRENETVRKIQRCELSILPRRCWNLANNSFLMHGYHNYHHLLLVEEDGHYWLGVPGVYASKEAKAAELFGFPQFTQTYTERLELDNEERNSSDKFGYWCRYIK